MWVGIGILGVFLWILLALLPAKIAANKGRSFLLWFLFSILFWWITLFVALAMKDDTPLQPA
jgi:ABC-type Mn2+/Zn2+ transport system permease subunit